MQYWGMTLTALSRFLTSVVCTDLTAFSLDSRASGGYLGQFFCWICAACLSEPLPHYTGTIFVCGPLHHHVYPLQSILWSIIDSILITFGQIGNFSSNLVTFYLRMYIKIKNTSLCTYITNILARLLNVNMKNCLTPKIRKMCDPILVTLLKMRPHDSQTSREIRSHPVADPHQPLIRKNPDPPRRSLP